MVVLVCWVGVAIAQPVETVVQGRVTDVLGRPVANARVYVLEHASVPTRTTTDKDGRYSIEVTSAGMLRVVVAIDKVHVFRTVQVQPGAMTALDIAVDLDTQGGEVINIEDRRRPQPAKPAESKMDPQKPPPYSEEAVERDAWARAWLLLDVDETGKVTRLKLLKKPGFDLDAIAIDTAFKMRFDPARDAQGQPMKTFIVWSMEWPSYGWLQQGNGTTLRMPRSISVRGHTVSSSELNGDDAEPTERGIDIPRRPLASGTATEQSFAAVPCAGSGPLNLDMWNPAYRDCSRPDLRGADALPWITPQTAATAIAQIQAADRQLALHEVVTPGSKVPSIVSTGIAASLTIALIVSYRRYVQHASAVEYHPYKPTIPAEEYFAEIRARDKWAKISVALSAAVAVSGGITLFLWNRNQSKRSFSVQPTTGAGASASLGMSF